MCAGQTEGGLWAAQTHTRTSPHNGLLSMPGQGHGWGPQQGHLMGSLEEASLLPDTSLAAMVGTSQGAKRPREARERGPCGETHIDGHRDKPGTHNAMGAIPIGARIDTGMSTQQAAMHGKAHGYNACHDDQTPRGFDDLFSDIPQRHRDTKTTSGIPTHMVTHTTNPTVTRIRRDGAWNGPQRHQAASSDIPSGDTGTFGKGPTHTHSHTAALGKMVALRLTMLTNTRAHRGEAGELLRDVSPGPFASTSRVLGVGKCRHPLLFPTSARRDRSPILSTALEGSTVVRASSSSVGPAGGKRETPHLHFKSRGQEPSRPKRPGSQRVGSGSRWSVRGGFHCQPQLHAHPLHIPETPT